MVDWVVKVLIHMCGFSLLLQKCVFRRVFTSTVVLSIIGFSPLSRLQEVDYVLLRFTPGRDVPL